MMCTMCAERAADPASSPAATGDVGVDPLRRPEPAPTAEAGGAALVRWSGGRRLRRLLGPHRDSSVVLRKVSLMRGDARRGHFAGTVSRDLVGPDTLFPLISYIDSTGRTRRTIWLYEDTKGAVPTGVLAVTRRVEDQLDPPTRDVVLTLQLPRAQLLTVSITRARDLPSSGSVHVSERVFRSFGGGGSRRRATLTSAEGLSFPVRLHRRPIDDDHMLVPMSLRTLTGVKVGSRVQLTSLPRLSLWERRF